MLQSPSVVEFLGVGFHTMTLDGAARALLATSADEPFRYVVTPNVQHMVMILEDRAKYAPLYDKAWRTLCDSRVLARLAGLRGRRLQVVTGSDLTARVIEGANAAGMKVAIVGPSAEDCAKLRARYPRLLAACHTPPMGFIEHEAEIVRCIDFVVRERAPLVFLAVGTPRQELLAKRLAEHAGATGIGLCIGASIDFLTGKQRRAPVWMQKAGIEWLHRLLSDPVRLASRYLVECPKIFLLMLREHRRVSQP
ncbi:MAG: WecB/TagA/CpsF family glycosyltransferase [Hyphomicrobiaceae bacterium]|nr:MAG: WecB/TagA/CpsF family glycosyltransferase [Hyphomicrobiaceae bacterium]